ncbi:MAG: efflux RND transporter periplasmic adaptor subunit [Candidatus Aminicenantia bacterium]
MIFSKKVLLISGISLILIGLIVFLVIFKKENAPEENGKESSSVISEESEGAPLPVKVVKARKGDLIIRLKSLGQAIAPRKVVVKAEIRGVIDGFFVTEGKHVREGDLLVKLNDEEYKLKLKEAESRRLEKLSKFLVEGEYSSLPESKSQKKTELEKVKEEYERAFNLYKQGLISEKEFEKAKRKYELMLIETGEKREEIRASVAGLTQAEAEVRRAQMELGRTRVRAPFPGVITEIKISPKEHIEVGRELFTIVDLSLIEVEAKVLESEIGKMKIGREVILRFSAYPEKVFKGRVKAISPLVDPEDKTCRVIIDVANPGEEIKPGMHAEVEIAADIYKDRLLIPQEAILVRGGRKLAFVVENDLAKWRYIETGLENEDYAEVLDGIKEGELAITEGHFTLAHNARVRIIK